MCLGRAPAPSLGRPQQASACVATSATDYEEATIPVTSLVTIIQGHRAAQHPAQVAARHPAHVGPS